MERKDSSRNGDKSITKKLKIGLRLMWRNGMGYANHIGDDTVACAWKKYLERRDDVEWCRIARPLDPAFGDGVDCVIHFHHELPLDRGTKNFYYLQNSWPRNELWPRGTVGVFEDNKGRYDGYLFASDGLRKACGISGTVVPFAADPERFFPQKDIRFTQPFTFVGNDIRGNEADQSYLAPFIERGLSIYGGPRKDPRLEACRKGRASDEDLPKIYSSAQVNLNYHIPIALEYGVMNMRIYEVAACGGVLCSDALPCDFMWNPCDKPYNFASASPEAIEYNRKEVLSHHTWAHRCETLVQYLKGMI